MQTVSVRTSDEGMITQLRARNRVMRRLLASVLVASVTVALAPPLRLHEHAFSRECHRPASPGAKVSLSAATTSQCDDMSGSTCNSMIGCASVMPGVAVEPVRGVPTPVVGAAGWTQASGPRGRLGLGPPTPPPNS